MKRSNPRGTGTEREAELLALLGSVFKRRNSGIWKYALGAVWEYVSPSSENREAFVRTRNAHAFRYENLKQLAFPKQLLKPCRISFDLFKIRLRWNACVVFAALLIGAGTPLVEAKDDAPTRAKIEVDGLGWMGNRTQKTSLERLLGEERGVTLDANAIEDAALLLLSALESEGFLKAKLEAEIVTAAGETLRFTFDLTLATTLPRPLSATRVTFRAIRGERYKVNEVRIDGLTAVPLEKARSFYRPDNALFGGATRAYTPGRIRRASEQLTEQLRQQGYAQAEVRAAATHIDDATGLADVVVDVKEGPRWQVLTLRFEGTDPVDALSRVKLHYENQPWSPLWQQNAREAIRQVFYRTGYPDVNVALTPQAGATAGGLKPVTVTAKISTGPAVKVGQVRFMGNARTKESVLRRRVQTESGEPLNPLRLERARYRIARLGVFDDVTLHYEPAEGEVRDPVFDVKETRRWDTNLLLGYGSYEQLRGGVEVRQMNLFGLAHQSRLELVQSMKSSRGDYTYTVPEIFGESIDGSAKLFGLERKENAFLRQEYGVNVSLSRRISRIDGEARIGYTYQFLRNQDNQLSTRLSDGRDVTVGSVDFGLTSDRRDSPLRPRKGYRWFFQVEEASRNLGGEADFQRGEVGAAYHTSWGRTRWIHLGVAHGVITTLGATDDLLIPVNKRFFLGGDSSIRGYQSGDASPRDADGLFIGAKSYTLANAELEQALTSKWSVVVFGDALGMTARLANYPIDECLYSLGLGVRYQTLIGPVRLEYGRNIKPRAGDPSGTLHFSVGFPF